jgi:hypothetical protein
LNSFYLRLPARLPTPGPLSSSHPFRRNNTPRNPPAIITDPSTMAARTQLDARRTFPAVVKPLQRPPRKPRERADLRIGQYRIVRKIIYTGYVR